MFLRALRTNFQPVQGIRFFAQAAKTALPPKNAARAVEPSTLVEVKKSNLKQSPLRMKFLAMLIRDTWVPDALAQLKFSPKHKAVDLAKMVNRAVAIAKINYDAIPEELAVKEISVTKGASYKKIRIMGRGRAGIGMIRSTHVTIKVDKMDFDKNIGRARTPRQKALWTERKQQVEKLKAAAPAQ